MKRTVIALAGTTALAVLFVIVFARDAATQPLSPQGGTIVGATTGGGLQVTSSKLGLKTTCSSTQVLAWDGDSWECSSAGGGGGGGGTVTNIATTAPLAGGPITSTGTLSLTACSANQVYKMSGGVWTCAADADTTYTAGTGLQLIGSQFSANLTGATCATGQRMSALNSSGVGTCSADVVAVANGTGISTSTVSGTATITANLAGASCSAGQAMTALSATGTGTCSAVGTTTGTGSTNALTKWTGASALGTSGISDDGTTVSSTRQIQWGTTAPGAGQKWVFSGQQPTDTTMMYIRGDDSNHTVYEAISLWLDQRGTYNTTAQPSVANGLTVTVSTTKSAGANTLTNIGIDCIVGGGDANLCLRSQAGQGGISVTDDSLFGKITLNNIVSSASFVQTLAGAAGSAISFAGASPITTGGSITGSTLQSTGNVKLSGNTLWFDNNAQSQLYIYADAAGSSGNTNIDIQAGGTGKVRINANTGGSTNAGTGGFEVFGGANDGTANFTVAGSGAVSTISTVAATGSITSQSFMQANGGVYAGASSDVYLRPTDASIGFAYGTNATATGYINKVGYAEGTTQFRDLKIQDGKGADVVTVTGSSKDVAMAATMSVAGNTTFNGAINSFGDANSDESYFRTNVYSVTTSSAANKPAISSCGTGPGVVGGSLAFIVTPGTGSPTSCTATFADAFADTPSCVLTGTTSGTVAGGLYLSAVSTSAITITTTTGATLSGGIHVHCIGTSINPGSP